MCPPEELTSEQEEANDAVQTAEENVSASEETLADAKVGQAEANLSAAEEDRENLDGSE